MGWRDPEHGDAFSCKHQDGDAEYAVIGEKHSEDDQCGDQESDEDDEVRVVNRKQTRDSRTAESHVVPLS